MEEKYKGLNETLKLHTEELDKYVKNLQDTQDAICNILNTMTAILSFNKFNLSSKDIDSLYKEVGDIYIKFANLCFYINDNIKGVNKTYSIFKDVCNNAITVSKEREEEIEQLHLEYWPVD